MEWSIHKLMKLRLVFLQNSFNELVRYIYIYIYIYISIYCNFSGMLVQGQNQYEYKK
jgi:hypothetical protein